MTNVAQTKDILLAEDDIDDVVVFEMALKKLNLTYTLRHADNGDVLFLLLKDRVPYILFLDIMMPTRDGVSCLVEIRKNPEYDKLPIVMYTSNLSTRIIEECYRNGANLYLTKTSTFSELTKKLERVFALDWTDYLHYPPQDRFVLS